MSKQILLVLLAAAAIAPRVHGYSTLAALPNHTFYAPTDMTANPGPYPVILWGNGGCDDEGALHHYFLQTLCDAGYVAIASGDPITSPLHTTADLMTQSLNWVTSTTQNHDFLQGKLDTSRIAACGHSCGGGEAQTIAAQNPDVIKLLGLYSSGWGTVSKVPTFLITGGSGDTSLNIPVDLALSAAHALYPKITAPKWIADLENTTVKGKVRGVGHDGTFWLQDTNDSKYTGGEYAQLSILMFNYRFKGMGSLSALSRPGWANIQSSGWTASGTNTTSSTPTSSKVARAFR